MVLVPVLLRAGFGGFYRAQLAQPRIDLRPFVKIAVGRLLRQQQLFDGGDILAIERIGLRLGAMFEQVLAQAGMLHKNNDPVVVLGRGEITRVLTVKVQRISKGARAKIEAAGGTVEVIG